MIRRFIFFTLLLSTISSFAQSPRSYSSSEILLQIKKLGTFGSVLYVAAHPDDENTRLLAWLANEKKVRTGYLSLTRGDGGQNLIGDDQGIDLGLIRTQELLSARRIDGAEQFFSRAFDFGFSKNPEEALRIWDHDKILSDVVWVIRKFRPDVIITRFPTTGEGGHGHHTASAILAGEAFDAAADATKFPEQLAFVKPWQAKRLLWNTFNFGTTNTTREDQFKLDAGGYNALLGKSYGEIAAESRSRHKSQGFGVPGQRGTSIEYFSLIKGTAPVNDLLDGVDSSFIKSAAGQNFMHLVNHIAANFNLEAPQQSVPALQALSKIAVESGISSEKQLQINNIIAACAGLFMEAAAPNQLNATGDSMKIKFTLNSRAGAGLTAASVTAFNNTYPIDVARINENSEVNASVFIPSGTPLSGPYYLNTAMSPGSFNITDQQLRGLPEVNPYNAEFDVTINNITHRFNVPVMYKYTDPVKGELYEPVQIVAPFSVSVSPSLLVLSGDNKTKHSIQYTVEANAPFIGKLTINSQFNNRTAEVVDTISSWKRNEKRTFYSVIENVANAGDASSFSDVFVSVNGGPTQKANVLKKISYDHIPDVFYHYPAQTKIIRTDVKTDGKTAGYIAGAGDRVPQALEQLGYKVTMLQEKDITAANLKQFDVIITGVRAYNINAWLSNAYPVLMEFVRNGGTLLVQYNTNNSIGPVKAAISSFPFTISRNRITNESADVNFLLPQHPLLNYPNKITNKDFEGWIQERSIYNAEAVDPAYQQILGMKDPGENDQSGSLISTDYGKGRFIYTGLVFFRELPAGVTGAYRLFANLIAKKK